jgi:hypothetical protein
MMNALDGDLFSEIFGARLEGLREDEPDIVAIDGKTSRRSHSGDRHPLQVVFAWAARQGLVLGQQATDAKSNEITAIPLLLARLQLTGALVTIDAMGAQTKIARTILGRGADWKAGTGTSSGLPCRSPVTAAADGPQASPMPISGHPAW